MCPASVATNKIYAWLYEHKTLGRDKEVATGEIDVMPFLSYWCGSIDCSTFIFAFVDLATHPTKHYFIS